VCDIDIVIMVISVIVIIVVPSLVYKVVDISEFVIINPEDVIVDEIAVIVDK